ncbi:hypothetical protein BDY24DRAFT_76350 [Mrakia frigida]|uniref:uncharacterized protein n=1 Tax=Mrakia frigida TaxID=29902 RepID=UPI003FCC24D8
MLRRIDERLGLKLECMPPLPFTRCSTNCENSPFLPADIKLGSCKFSPLAPSGRPPIEPNEHSKPLFTSRRLFSLPSLFLFFPFEPRQPPTTTPSEQPKLRSPPHPPPPPPSSSPSSSSTFPSSKIPPPTGSTSSSTFLLRPSLPSVFQLLPHSQHSLTFVDKSYTRLQPS